VNRKTLLLVAVHIALGTALAAAGHWERQRPSIWEPILLVAAFAVVFCQSGLVGFWTAMSRASAWKRAIGLIAGMIVLETMLLWCRGAFMFMPTMVTGLVAVLLALLRIYRAELLAVADPPREFSRKTLQFSIRGLMLLTLLVAVLVTVGKQFRETDLYDYNLFLLAAWALAFATTDIAAVWAALSPNRPLLPGSGVLVLSVAVGFLVCWGLGGVRDDWIYVPAIMFLQTAMLLASLLVVRSNGYRMVRYRTAMQAPSDADPGQGEVI
jgi:hydrogenase-4 membrane subunit HyfE